MVGQPQPEATASGQGTLPHDQRRRRRPRRLRRVRFPKCALHRPGRFFRPRRALIWTRLEMKPRHLGESDWLLYRRRHNPYKSRTWKARRYEQGFADAKSDLPNPPWSPIP